MCFPQIQWALSQQHLEQNKERKVKVKRAEIRRMNVRLSVGRVWNTVKGMRTAGWCMVFLGMVAGFTGSAAAAENTAATRTALAVSTNDAGPRTKVTLTAHVSADVTGAPSGVVNFRSGNLDLGSAFLDGEGNAALETDILPAGSHQVVAIFQGGAGYPTSLSTPAHVQANVSTVAGFTVAAAPTSLSTAVGGFVSQRGDGNPGQWLQRLCQPFVFGVAGEHDLQLYPAECAGELHHQCRWRPDLHSWNQCDADPNASALAGTRAGNAGNGGMRRYAFVFPALFGLVGLGACKRRAWRNLALGVLAFAGAMGMTACPSDISI